MRPHHFAKIAIRVLALFLVYRALEFGITQMIQGQFAIGMMGRSALTGEYSIDPKITEAIKTLRIMTGIGAIVPLFLAGVLWFAAPILSLWIAGSEEDSRHENDGLPLRATLIQTAAIIMIAVAASTLPKLIYDFQADHLRDPSITLMTSKVFPDSIQFLAKTFVGGIMLLVVKKTLPRRPNQLAEQAAAGDGDKPKN